MRTVRPAVLTDVASSPNSSQHTSSVETKTRVDCGTCPETV